MLLLCFASIFLKNFDGLCCTVATAVLLPFPPPMPQDPAVCHTFRRFFRRIRRLVTPPAAFDERSGSLSLLPPPLTKDPAVCRSSRRGFIPLSATGSGVPLLHIHFFSLPCGSVSELFPSPDILFQDTTRSPSVYTEPGNPDHSTPDIHHTVL